MLPKLYLNCSSFLRIRRFQFTVLSLLALLVILVLGNTDSAFAQTLAQVGNPQDWLRNALQWIEDLGSIGVIAFIALYIIAAVAFIPGSLLTLGSGVLFGILWGTVYVFIGATLGATAAFLVGRYLARNWVAAKIANNPKFAAIDEAVGKEGLKIVLLTRLSPVFPFNLLNYAYGLTKVSLKDYVLGSVGMLPGTLLYVYIGSLAGSIATIGSTKAANNPYQWVVQLLGFAATLGVTILITRIARKALATAVDNTPPSDSSQSL